MEDAVCDRLDKMQLTTEEEETIAISDDGRLEAIESCTLSLIGKFLTCKSFNKAAMKNTIRRAWGLNESMQILEVGPNLFQFKFQSEFDLERILRGGPWSFDNQLLLLQRWKKGMTVGNIRLESASLWVQIWEAPFDMVSPHVAREVGSRLGKVEEVEWKKRKDDISMFMRVRVALPIAKPIRRGGFIAGSDGVKTWVSFKYERLPIFCHFCGILGHDLRHCAAHYAAEKKGERIEYQYGDFLRAVGGRPRTPYAKASGQMAGTEEVTDYAAETGLKQGVQEDPMSTTAAAANLGDAWNPSAVENPRRVINDEAVNPGLVAEITLSTNERIQSHADVKGAKSAAEETAKEIKKNGQVSRVLKGFDENVGADFKSNEANLVDVMIQTQEQGLDASTLSPGMNGPTNVKPKGSWTRVNRMDLGLGDVGKAIMLHGLGKREARESYEGQAVEQTRKKGKWNSDDENNDHGSAGVESHPCREQ